MEFNPNKTPVEILKEGSVGLTYFTNTYGNVTGKQYNVSQKEISNALNDVDLNSDC